MGCIVYPSTTEFFSGRRQPASRPKTWLRYPCRSFVTVRFLRSDYSPPTLQNAINNARAMANSVDQDNKAKQTGLSAWSWKRLRHFRAGIRSRYDHVSRRGGWRFLGFIYIPAVAEYHIPKTKRARRSTFLSELERLAALKVPWACAILSYHALLEKTGVAILNARSRCVRNLRKPATPTRSICCPGPCDSRAIQKVHIRT